MNARLFLAGLIVVLGAASAQAQGLLEKFGKIAKEVIKNAEQQGGIPGLPGVNGGAPANADAPGYLGLVIGDPRPGITGMPVEDVRAGSPAAGAGFRRGDLVLNLDGVPVNNLDDFQTAMTGLKAGDRVLIKYHRDGATQSIAVKLTQRAATGPVPGTTTRQPGTDLGDGVFRRPAPGSNAVPAGQRASLGVTVMPLTDDARRKYALDVPRGALVTAVRPGGPAEAAGIVVGTAIAVVDGKRIESADELIDLIAASRPGQELEVTFYVRDKATRKAIRLGSSDPGATRPPADPFAASGEPDRPLLRKVLGALDGPADPDAAPPLEAPESGDLRKQVELLQLTIERLTKRVQDLEAKLGPAKPELPPSPFDEK